MKTIKVYQNGNEIFSGVGTHTVPMRNVGPNVQDRWVEFSIMTLEDETYEFSGFDLVLIVKE